MSYAPTDEDIGQHGYRTFPLRVGLASGLRLTALAFATAVMAVTTAFMPTSPDGTGAPAIFGLLGLMAGVGVLYVLLGRIQAGAIKVDWFGFAFTGLIWDTRYRWSEVEAIQSDEELEIILGSGRRILNRGWLMNRQQRQSAWSHLEQRLNAWQRRPDMELPGGGFSLAGDRIVLRPWKTDEWPAFHRIYNDPSLIRWQLYERMPVWRTREKFSMITAAADASRVYGWSLAVVVRPTSSKAGSEESVVGHLDLWVSCLSGRRLSCGYGIFEEARGRGYATEALQLICDEALTHWGVEGMDATCFEGNRASQTVLERAGFVKREAPSITVRKRLKKVRMHSYVLNA